MSIKLVTSDGVFFLSSCFFCQVSDWMEVVEFLLLVEPPTIKTAMT